MIRIFNLIFLFAISLSIKAQQITLVQAPEIIEQSKNEKGVVVINFWSTWCKPCIDEIPHFIKVYDSLKEQGVQLWLVSQDTRDLYQSGKLKTYIAKKEGWSKAKLFWMNETNADYYCPIIDTEWSGVIPATLILNPEKGYRRFYEEAMTAETLMAEIAKALER